MEKDDFSQLELFSQQDNSPQEKKTADKRFLSGIRVYEKKILTVIAAVSISIISFSFGVERGKRVSLTNGNQRFDVANVKSATPQERIAPAASLKTLPLMKNEELKALPESPLDKQGYYIQLASYKTKASAQKEMDSLRKQGLSAIILTKGSYNVLCIGSFNNRENAQPTLVQMKKRFKDCYLRRL